MKIKFFKIVLPAFAFMLAIAFSFATYAQNGAEEVFVTGDIKDTPTTCVSSEQDCAVDGSENCTVVDDNAPYAYPS